MAGTLLRLAAAALAAYAAVVLLAWWRQDYFLYFPARYGLEELRREAPRLGLEPWPAGGSDYLGLLGDTTRLRGERDRTPRGTVLVFHGNAGSAADRTYFREALEPLGLRVILAEYPGYGARPGEPSEASITASALEAARLAAASFPGPLYLWGESLGCAVATAVAREIGADAAGVALVTPWADLPRLAGKLYPWLPVRLFLRDRYDSIGNLKDYRGPVAVLAAGRDEIIPAEETRALFESLRGPKTFRAFEGAGHNSWPGSPGEKWWSETADFLRGGAG